MTRERKQFTEYPPLPMRMHKRLLQFNQVVFSAGWVTDPSYSVAVKGDTQSYTNNAHGGYYPTYGEFSKIEVGSFSATVTIDFSKINVEDRVAYARFLKRQLGKSGKLWATQNGGEVIWTRARIITKNEVVDDSDNLDKIKLNLTFELIDGFWRLAKKTRTWLCVNWCPSRFRDYDPYYCFDQDDLTGQCDATGNSKCYPCLANLFKPPKIIGCYDPDAPDGVDTGYHPLCHYTQRELQEMFSSRCPNEVFIDYSCEAEEAYFCYDASWGKKYRLRADGITGNSTIVAFCSKTDLPTEFVRIRLSGTFVNPLIRQLKPQYDYNQMMKDGILTPNKKVPAEYELDHLQVGDPKDVQKFVRLNDATLTYGYGIKLYYTNDPKDPDGKKNPGAIYNITDNAERTNTPVFQLQPGINYFEITGNAYDKDSFVYIDPIEITD